MNGKVLCIGEVLWDALPAGLFLGGAPFNVACHLHELGLSAVFASRVGNDALGREILRRLRHRGISTDHIQTDDNLPTGFVVVGLDDTGVPDFTIVEPSAWDAIELTDELREEASEADAVVFGSLAQRNSVTRETIRTVLSGTSAIKVFDVNLRPPFDTKDIVKASLETADIVKLNDDELQILDTWFDLCGKQDHDPETAADRLAEVFQCTAVCVTRGADGAALWRDGSWYEHPGFSISVADTVGSGDAFLASFLQGYLSERSPEETLARANATGAYVATRNGATPEHDSVIIKRFISS